ncbi:MAG TPA: class I SAM-dependent methyltransferase [Anaeromyxobacteraceae bacterium]|nr:class I SAM-dependent methyltransferase [Anaeromyxobacteraceae bacterium]
MTVGPASRISLCVAFPDGTEPQDQTVFERLELALPGRGPVELSTCRYVAEPAREGWAGRLVFLQDVYDLERLFRDGTVTNLRAFFANVPMVLEQKLGIRPEFKDFVADAVYDLSVQKRFFDEQDRILAQEPPQVAEAAREAILASEGPRFLAFFDDHLAKLEALVGAWGPEEYERHGFYLRRMAWPYILGSEIMKRTNLKPRGYAGDAEIMRMIYEHRYEGRYLFNQLMHKHPVEHAGAQSVRARRRMIPGVLREVLGRFPRTGPHGFRILSVACGPAWELQDLFATADDFSRFHCALLDQDREALAMAAEGIRRIEAARGIGISAEYVEDSVRTMLRVRDLGARYGRFHFAYSMGLFDYLTTPVARAVLARLWEMILPGGTMLVGNFNVGCRSRTYMDYWCDWSLYYRTEEAFLALADGLPGVDASITWEETRSQMFLRLERAG